MVFTYSTVSEKMTIKLMAPHIEQRKFDNFMRDFKKGKFGTQRLGQAFFNYFDLHKVDDQTSLHNLYAKDGEHAINSIKEIFTFN